MGRSSAVVFREFTELNGPSIAFARSLAFLRASLMAMRRGEEMARGEVVVAMAAAEEEAEEEEQAAVRGPFGVRRGTGAAEMALRWAGARVGGEGWSGMVKSMVQVGRCERKRRRWRFEKRRESQVAECVLYSVARGVRGGAGRVPGGKLGRRKRNDNRGDEDNSYNDEECGADYLVPMIRVRIGAGSLRLCGDVTQERQSHAGTSTSRRMHRTCTLGMGSTRGMGLGTRRMGNGVGNAAAAAAACLAPEAWRGQRNVSVGVSAVRSLPSAQLVGDE